MRNFILKGFTALMAFVAMLGACMLDSVDMRIPLAMVAVGTGWCLLFAYANKELFLPEEDKR